MFTGANNGQYQSGIICRVRCRIAKRKFNIRLRITFSEVDSDFNGCQ